MKSNEMQQPDLLRNDRMPIDRRIDLYNCFFKTLSRLNVSFLELNKCVFCQPEIVLKKL